MRNALSLFLMLVLASGCISKSASDAKVRAAYFAGQQEALARSSQTTGVWFVGNVKNPIVPWQEGLTLADAFLAAEYQGNLDPTSFRIIRNGQAPFVVTAKQLLSGYVQPVLIGDKIEIH